MRADIAKERPVFARGDNVVIDAKGQARHGREGTVNEQRCVGPPLDMVMVGVTFPDGWSQWFLPKQVRRAP